MRILFVLMFVAAPLRAADVYFDKDCLPKVLEVIRGTRHRLSASVFEVNQPDIVEALLELHFQGKEVQILSDRRQAKGEHSRMLDLYLMGVDVRLNSKKRLQHNKYAISDDKISMSGSFNWTNSASKSNSEDLTVLRTGLIRWSENQSISDTRAKFTESWENNTEGKSDAYFETILKERKAEVRERLKPWAEKVLKEASGRDKGGARKLQAAFRLVDKLDLKDKSMLELIARRAEPGARSETGTRVLAIASARSGAHLEQGPSDHLADGRRRLPSGGQRRREGSAGKNRDPRSRGSSVHWPRFCALESETFLRFGLAAAGVLSGNVASRAVLVDDGIDQQQKCAETNQIDRDVRLVRLQV